MPLLAVALLAGCGGGSSPSAASGSAAPAGEQSPEQTAEAKAETAFARWAKCLREHGINAEVRPGGHGLILRGGSANPEPAEKTCAHFRPFDPGKTDASPQQKVENEEDLRKFAKCMREHGIHVETSAAGGPRIEFHPGAGAPNPQSPAFQRAQEVCSKVLPGGLP